MNVLALEHRNTAGEVEWVTLIVNGTTVTLKDAPGAAVHLTVVGSDGGPMIDLTIRSGPSGED